MRDRILDRVTACAVPFIVLLAPAGFGKTRVANAYAARFKHQAQLECVTDMSTVAALTALLRARGETAPQDATLQTLAERLWAGRISACVVIDAAERLKDETLRELLEVLLRSRPDDANIVVSTRREPLLFQFSALIGPHLVAVFRRPDLELSLADLSALVPAHATVSYATLFDIYSLTRGWPVASMSLVAASARGALEADTRRYDHPALHDLLDWVDREVIAVMPEELRDVMFRCIACTDTTPADFDAAFGTDPLRPDRRLYRNSQRADIGYAGEILVHPLLAFAVRARHAERLERCARDEAERFLANGQPVRAARALISVGDVERASRIVDDAGFDAMRNLAGFPYPGLALERHAATRPPFDRHPLLWLNLVPCRFHVARSGSLAREGAGILQAHESDLEPRLRRWIEATVAALFAECGDRLGAQRHIARLRELEDDADAQASLDVAEMYVDVAGGQYASAMERWKRVTPHFQSSPVWYALHLRCGVRAQVRLGDVDAGIDSLRSVLSLLRIGGCPSLAGFGAMQAAFLAWFKDDEEALKRYRREFSNIAKHYDVPVLWRCLSALYGYEFAGQATSNEYYDAISAIILAGDERDPERGRELALKAVGIADGGNDHAMQVAVRVLAAARGVADSQRLIAQAESLAAEGDSDALKSSVAAFRAGAPDIGYLQPHVDRVRRAIGPVAVPQPAAERALRVDVATGEILRGSTMLKTSEGTLQLATLLAVHGEANRDLIVDCLWPDLDGDAAVNALKMCVHRARAQLEDPYAIRVAKSIYSLGENVEATYTPILECAQRIARPLSDEQRIEYTGIFDRLTRGIASSRAPWPWFVPFGTALIDAMRRIGEALAEDQLDLGAPQTALQMARRMAGIDPLDESARALVMRAYGKLGNWTAAMREFQEYSETLKREMNAAPSERLKKLLTAS